MLCLHGRPGKLSAELVDDLEMHCLWRGLRGKQRVPPVVSPWSRLQALQFLLLHHKAVVRASDCGVHACCKPDISMANLGCVERYLRLPVDS